MLYLILPGRMGRAAPPALKASLMLAPAEQLPRALHPLLSLRQLYQSATDSHSHTYHSSHEAWAGKHNLQCENVSTIAGSHVHGSQMTCRCSGSSGVNSGSFSGRNDELGRIRTSGCSLGSYNASAGVQARLYSAVVNFRQLRSLGSWCPNAAPSRGFSALVTEPPTEAVEIFDRELKRKHRDRAALLQSRKDPVLEAAAEG
eukprot:CAMPEP_0206140356 /NCGR_PEP_ID=MMETSP1473-20131121/9178_1 /ASSEMBLY_ACC=CAM_ASM_001109 /TAXON_ID=1461547 /ORGANISM="Stichococcus sp, Strain RCC1054" /LENGTH=201 /DNA_ID=CAMNT_0053534479 /DNA_START=91 /DNA_END=693 /DNA_ORIENTATION=+